MPNENIFDHEPVEVGDNSQQLDYNDYSEVNQFDPEQELRTLADAGKLIDKFIFLSNRILICGIELFQIEKNRTIDDIVQILFEQSINITYESISEQLHDAIGSFNDESQCYTDSKTIFSHNGKCSIVFKLNNHYTFSMTGSNIFEFIPMLST